MLVRDAMTTDVLTVSERDPLAAAARRMAERDVGAAVVEPPGGGPPGILTEHDVVRVVADAGDPGTETVIDCCTAGATSAPPDWPLLRAAETMVAGGFRQLVVIDGSALVGLVSMRDIVRCWLARRLFPTRGIQIREAMTTDLPPVTLDEALHGAARTMADSGAGAVIAEAEKPGGPPAIVTEGVIVRLVAAAQDAATERVRDHLSMRTTFSAPDWSLKQAAEAMTKGGFQHVVVVREDGFGLISMRDVVSRWVGEGLR